MFKVKVLSVICAVVVLCASVLPCFAADVKPEVKYAHGGKIDGNIVDISRKNAAKPHYSAASSALFSKQTVTSRETLTDDEKEIYDYFKNAPLAQRSTMFNITTFIQPLITVTMPIWILAKLCMHCSSTARIYFTLNGVNGGTAGTKSAVRLTILMKAINSVFCK